jgi:ATP-dependent Clp protease protease subunit
MVVWILSENLSDNPPEALTLLINSQGGDLTAAFALIEIMYGSRIPVRTVALGEICSAGLLIFMAGQPGERILTPSVSIMSHHYSGGVEGNYHEIMNLSKEFEYAKQRMINHYVHCTGLTEEVIKDKLVPHRDVYLTPQEAIEFNIADSIRGWNERPVK